MSPASATDFVRFIRFDENDLSSNTNEVLLSLANRIYAKRGNSVEEIFTWELFQKRYFDPTFGGALIPGQRNVIAPTADLTAYAFLVGPRSYSPVVSVLRMSPIAAWECAGRPTTIRAAAASWIAVSRWTTVSPITSCRPDTIWCIPTPAITAAANQFRVRGGFGDPNHKGFNAGVEAIYDYKQGAIQYTTSQVTYNTNCCGLSVQFHRFNVGSNIGARNEFRVAFAVANISTPLGNLKKQDRMF